MSSASLPGNNLKPAVACTTIGVCDSSLGGITSFACERSPFTLLAASLGSEAKDESPGFT